MAKPTVLIRSQTRNDKTITVRGTVTGNPTSLTIAMPADANAEGAVSQAEVPLVLKNSVGDFEHIFSALPYGNYAPVVIKASNSAGNVVAQSWPMRLYVPGTAPVGTPKVLLPEYLPPVFTAPKVALGAEVTTFALQSTSTVDESNVFFYFGHPFRVGDVSPNDNLVGKITGEADVPLQFNVKSTHSDGSVRHAIISGKLPSLNAGQIKNVSIVRSAVSMSKVVPTPSAVINGLTVDLEVTINSVLYRASAHPAMLTNDASCKLWFGGSIATDYIQDLPLVNAQTQEAHPFLTAQFAVCRFAGQNTARINVVLESTPAYTAIADVTYTGQVLINGVKALDILKSNGAAVMHPSLGRWKRTLWWNNPTPVHVRHNRRYLSDSGAVPNYDPRIEVPESTLAGYVTLLNDKTRYDFFTYGNFQKAFGTAGGRPDLGLAPSWYAAYIVSQDKRAKDLMLAMGECGGSFRIHRRDNVNGSPMKGNVVDVVHFPKATAGNLGDSKNAATGQYEKFAAAPSSATDDPDQSHQPSIAYYPYLVTGDWFYLEELMFWAAWNANSRTPGGLTSYRQSEKGIVTFDQVRGQAWSMRTLGEVAAFTPDDHPMKPSFLFQLRCNIERLNSLYVDNPAANKLGVITDPNDGEVVYNIHMDRVVEAAKEISGTSNPNVGIGLYQDDFFTSAIGHIVDLGFSSARRILLWKSKFPIGRMIDPGASRMDAAYPQAFAIKASATSPYFETIVEGQRASLTPAVNQYAPNTPERLAQYNIELGRPAPDVVQDQMLGYTHTESYSANMQPALAYAVESGVRADGSQAWTLFDARARQPNWGTSPQFAIVPRTTMLAQPVDPEPVDPTDPPTEPVDPPPPDRGVLDSTFCEGVNKMGKFHDGEGGFYTEVIQVNSTDCGYEPPPSDPDPDPPVDPEPDPPVDPNIPEVPPPQEIKTMKLADRVKQSSTTVGTNNFELDATPVKDFQPFYPAMPIGSVTPYSVICTETGQWENGIGKVLSATVLERTTVTSSSSNGAKVNFLAGKKDVSCDLNAGLMGKFASTASSSTKVISDPATASFLIEIQGEMYRVPMKDAINAAGERSIDNLQEVVSVQETDQLKLSRAGVHMQTTITKLAAAVAALLGSSPGGNTATVPGAPTNVTATPGNGTALVAFSAPSNNGGKPVTSYIVTSSTGKVASGAVSPINVTGLTNGVAVTFTVKATNEVGTGPASSPSSSVTPVAPPVTGGTAATVKNLWTGTPTKDGAIISAKLNTANSANTTRVACSTSPDLSNPIYSGNVTPDTTFRIAKHVVNNLQPNTEYYYGIEVDGVLDTATTGRFTTLPTPNTPASFRLVMGCCSNHLSSSTQPAWQAIRELFPRPLAFLHLGDIIYSNSSATDVATKVGIYDSVMSGSAQGFATRHQTMREVPTVYMWDDHDFGPDNAMGIDASGAPRSYRQSSLDGFRMRVPAFIESTDSSDTVDHTFVVGRVKVIMSDLRSSRWTIDTNNVAQRSMMGAAQKQRWKNHIADAASKGQFVVWCSSVTYVGGDWAGYENERAELANHVKACGMGGKVAVICGDAHSQAYHTGIDYATDGGAVMPVLNVGALHSSYSQKGGPYTFGPVAQSATSNYAIMDITDDGTNLTVHWTGKQADGNVTLLEHSFTGLGLVQAPVATAPGIPPAPVATADVNSAQLKINPPSNDGGSPITEYIVTTIPAGGVDTGSGSNNTQRVITNLTAGTAYQFNVKAKNVVGTSAASPNSNSVVPTAPVVTTVFEATGGTITEPGDGYKYWEFKADETMNVTTAGNVEYLVVAGGGGGSAHGTGRGGGGGAGGVRIGSLQLAAGPLAIKVGLGGLNGFGNTAGGSNKGLNGGNSSIGSLVEAIGGGAGGYSTFAANNGGSGGGAGAGDTSAGPGQATTGQGNIGGAAVPNSNSAERISGGGGGAGGPGQQGVAGVGGKGGDGGEGITIWGRTLAGGGGGIYKLAKDGGLPGLGKAGGGNGRTVNTENEAAMDALPNTGSGGGGSTGSTGSFYTAGKGGSGIVVLRRPVTAA